MSDCLAKGVKILDGMKCSPLFAPIPLDTWNSEIQLSSVVIIMLFLLSYEVVQRVIVNEQSSKTFHVNYGVPQGSCLGPVLLLLYASRLFEVVKKHLPSVHG